MKSRATQFFDAVPKLFRVLLVHPVFSVIVASAAIYGFYTSYEHKSTTTPYVRDLREVVEVHGKITPAQETSLSFPVGGKVASVLVDVGTNVVAGQVLGSLFTSDIYNAVLNARANLEKVQAGFDTLTRAPKGEVVVQKTEALTNAQNSLEDFVETLPGSFHSTDAILTDAIRTKLSSLFVLSQGRYVMHSNSCDQLKSSSIETLRTRFENDLGAYQKNIGSISSFSKDSDVEVGLAESYKISQEGKSFLDALETLLSSGCNPLDTSLNIARNTVLTSRSTLNTLIGELSSKQNVLMTLKNTIKSNTDELNLLNVSENSKDINAGSAALLSAKAYLRDKESQVSSGTLVAPFNGTVTSRTITAGEVVNPHSQAVSLIAESGFQVEASLTESEMAKVAVGDHADITLEAFGPNKIVQGVVTRIDPNITYRNGIQTHNVVITFKEKYREVRKGMTVTVQIITATRVSVLALPAAYVRVLPNGVGVVNVVTNNRSVSSRQVTLGITGDNGYVEIVSGLGKNEVIKAQ